MTPHDSIQQALRSLSEKSRHLEAPPRIEQALVSAFRAERDRRRISVWLALSAAAAALVVASLISVRNSPAPVVAVPPVSTSTDVVVSVPIPESAAEAKPVVRPLPRPSRLPDSPREIVTEFFPVSNIAAPLESGALIRVRVPAATLQTVGLPVREDRWFEEVDADLLVGQEGIVRAIRFVDFER